MKFIEMYAGIYAVFVCILMISRQKAYFRDSYTLNKTREQTTLLHWHRIQF